MGLLDRWRDKKEEKTDEELYGGIGEWILARFGISQENIELVKSALDSVEKVEYEDRVEYNISLKNVKVIVSK